VPWVGDKGFQGGLDWRSAAKLRSASRRFEGALFNPDFEVQEPLLGKASRSTPARSILRTTTQVVTVYKYAPSDGSLFWHTTILLKSPTEVYTSRNPVCWIKADGTSALRSVLVTTSCLFRRQQQQQPTAQTMALRRVCSVQMNF
jgi:hypothetical protein